MGKQKKSRHLVLPGDGDDCPHCGRPMQIRTHPQITAKHMRQPYHFSRRFCCMHDDCRTTTVMPPRYAVLHCSGEKRRYFEARFLSNALGRQRQKEVTEAKERGQRMWGDTWHDDDDEAS
jgi:hypothetical protein